ncbi:SorC family transcriptional regulator [Vagococcus penaei]|uniref:SorC family transcriptional regulator n=1 Tax=Vagococcus penaei TaxID=633807 RepID=A0A1Q2D4P2_9ENTE|nr:sugar-binding domain-containing protein [Vagococcus penaei]AQP53343.1 SorC family transcriptional regulator [Vagococcus penaei]RSU04114.1 SorC family transcriptional regulator [Vagococcus penaei]
MNRDVEMLERIAPDIIQVVEERFRILRNIYWMQPVGRRTLSIKMNVTERILRTETEFLKQQNFINVSKSGMTLTDEGLDVYRGLESFIESHSGMRKKERKLAERLGIAHCVIVSGDSDSESKVLESFGPIATDILASHLPDGDNIIAVMGGTTMATLAKNMQELETPSRHNLFVPARGGIGETINIQANSISGMMAEKTGGDFKVLYVPEQVSHETYEILLQEPTVQRVLQLIDNANCVIHSIGQALRMAKRRGMTEEGLSMLKNNHAVAESFGYFFNEDGKVVYKIPRIGLQLKDLENIPYVLAVAGGKHKAKAIQAYIKNAPSQTWLITDEGAANQILKEETL